MSLSSTLKTAAPVLLGVLVAAGAAQAQPRVEVKDAAARVVVIAERRADVQVEISRPNPRLPLTVRRTGDRVEVEGDLRGNRIRSCEGGRGDWGGDILNPPTGAHVEIRGVGRVPVSELPVVVVRTPLDARVTAGGAVWGSVARTSSLELGALGCGDWTVGNVAGRMSLKLAGSGDVRAGSSGSAVLRLAGSGDIDAGPVRGPVDAEVAGSGDVTVMSAQGAVRLALAGSGDLEVRNGQADEVRIRVAGSGDVRFGGTARSASIDIAGSGDVEVARVTGPVNRRVIGSGEVTVNGRTTGRREDMNY